MKAAEGLREGPGLEDEIRSGWTPRTPWRSYISSRGAMHLALGYAFVTARLRLRQGNDLRVSVDEDNCV